MCTPLSGCVTDFNACYLPPQGSRSSLLAPCRPITRTLSACRSASMPHRRCQGGTLPGTTAILTLLRLGVKCGVRGQRLEVTCGVRGQMTTRKETEAKAHGETGQPLARC